MAAHPWWWGWRTCLDRTFPALPDNDTLVLTVDQHIPVHVVGEGVDMGGILILGLVGAVSCQSRAGCLRGYVWAYFYPSNLDLPHPGRGQFLGQ